MQNILINNEMFITNRSRFTEQMQAKSMAVFTSAVKMPRNGDQFFPFRQQSDFFYLTGIQTENTRLLLFPDCPNPMLREVLFVPKHDEVKAIWEGHQLSFAEAKSISGIKLILATEQFETIMQEAMNYSEGVYLNNNEYIKYFSEIAEYQSNMISFFKQKYPLHTYHRAAPLLEKIRTIKQKSEIEILQTACDITGKAFDRLLNFPLAGKFEYEVQAEIDHEFTIRKANGHGYLPIIAGGENACVLHYIDNDCILVAGDLLLLDFGAEYANYSADMSRTIPVNGKFTSRQKQCYEAVLRVFHQAIKLYIPGNTIDQINREVWKMMEQEMIGLGLFTAAEVEAQNPEKPLYRKYLMHGVAHPIGLDVHDVGSKFEPLQAGMVITCEPGIYIREEKIGIRIENDILVTESEPIDLMAHIPVTVEEIEKVMSETKVT
jgi:Xaa-Pro aminopeptidase